MIICNKKRLYSIISIQLEDWYVQNYEKLTNEWKDESIVMREEGGWCIKKHFIDYVNDKAHESFKMDEPKFEYNGVIFRIYEDTI